MHRQLGRHGYTGLTASTQFTLHDVAAGHFQHSQNKRHVHVLLFKCHCVHVLLVFNSLCYTNHFNWLLLLSFLLSCFLQFLVKKASANIKWLFQFKWKLLQSLAPLNVWVTQCVTSHEGTRGSSVWLCEEEATGPGQQYVRACWVLTVYEPSLLWFDGVSVLGPEIKIIPLHATRKGSHMHG